MKKLNLATKILVPVGMFALFMGILWLMGGTAKAEVKTLQQSVEMAQADYELSQSQAKDAVVAACQSWMELAIAKAQLADAMKIDSTINLEALKTKDCGVAVNLIPASF